MVQMVVVGDDLVALAFTRSAATINGRLDAASTPVAEAIAETQRHLAPELSGETTRSISAVRSELDDVLWEIGPETFYSRFLEDGTVKMAPRPFVGPSGDLHESDWYDLAAAVAADV